MSAPAELTRQGRSLRRVWRPGADLEGFLLGALGVLSFSLTLPATRVAVADLDVVGGHVEDAFGRLVETVRRTAGEERERARLRLLELFEVLGPDDPRVTAARGALARVLF